MHRGGSGGGGGKARGLPVPTPAQPLELRADYSPTLLLGSLLLLSTWSSNELYFVSSLSSVQFSSLQVLSNALIRRS